ncbi:MAG: hypothetical protein U0326_41970 [Polyangiales bacterium]
MSISDVTGRALRFGPVVSPLRAPDGRNLDLVSAGFQRTFPDTSQTTRDIEFGVRRCAGSGRTRGAFATTAARACPRGQGHHAGAPARAPGERGFNEVDGAPDTHGSRRTSRPLIGDLVAFRARPGQAAASWW